jgi:hypothetical protein
MMEVFAQTIKSVVSCINQKYYLPIMQRPFVWKEDQIVSLFDSIMRGYPFGAILLWKLPDEDRRNIGYYRFEENVISSPKKRLPRYSQANVLSSNAALVLDGQQRLTSLWVGLNGTIKDGMRGKPKKLYIDLLQDGFKTTDEGKRFGFSFRSDDADRLSGNHWFEVGKVLRISNAQELDAEFQKVIDNLRPYRVMSDKDVQVVKENLYKLHEMFCVCPVLVTLDYESSNYAEDVLDVFVRLNSGGTQLSSSDLLISTLTIYWPGLKSFKDCLEELKRDLNDIIKSGAKGASKDVDRIQDDFLMKALNFLISDHVEYNIKSFNEEFASKVHANWSDVSRALINGVKCAKNAGLSQYLTGINVLLPVVLYCQLTNFNPDSGTRSVESNLFKIRRWLSACLLAGVYSGSSDLMLTRHRDVLRQKCKLKYLVNFPDWDLNSAVDQNRIQPYSKQAIDNIINLNYEESKTKIAIALRLIQGIGVGDDFSKFDIDHLIPQSHFSGDTSGDGHSFANLALINMGDNRGVFKDKSLREKYNLIAPGVFRDGLLLGEVPVEFWQVDNFNKFKKCREDKLKNAFENLFHAGLGE